MKRIISLLLVIVMMLTGCTQSATQTSIQTSSVPRDISSEGDHNTNPNANSETAVEEPVFAEDEDLNFNSLNDPALLQYTEDNIWMVIKSV